MSPDGKLGMKFSRAIIPEQATENTRKLASVALADAVTMEIEDVDEIEMDKSIAQVIIEDITSFSFTMQVVFSDTKSISQELREPDILIVNVTLHKLFNDAETG